MKIYAQQGYGKGDKIHKGIEMNALNGVVLSPRDDKYESLITLKQELLGLNENVDILIDPQFYYATYIEGVSKNLDQLSFYPGPLTLSSLRSFRSISKLVSECLKFQNDLGVDTLVSPSILMPNFTDRQAQIALTMAEESSQQAQELGKPILISLIFQETALNDTVHVNEFLNELTMLNVEGFYIVVARNNTAYDQHFEEATALTNLLTMIYSLSDINEFKVIMGYSDIIGLLYLAAGASGISTGWHNSSRKFTVQQRILPSTGGRLPRERYTSIPLLNSVLVSELDSISRQVTARGGNLSDYLSRAGLDNIILTGNNPSDGWSRSISHLQHWSALQHGSQAFFTDTFDITERINNLETKINEAKALYTILDNMAIQLSPASTGKHLDTWQLALSSFKEQHNLNS
ncbi:hypothetical protein FZC66_04260 [Priestia megaterium]|nr:hypothetical protein FZC66_04260 [Priestia megaterium]